ncbi:hypothetical protein EGW08_021313 [Elysia chlorotica]|uniref:Uncharacterized protein n=1 Tax=Elysia chlorotica TaxID=188477 RepID=A0A3S1AZ51_ELYCH|nr:hypothetical protein EGW08_021313 [Elysia chlorotica]
MISTPDTQPLVPPALKRIKSDLDLDSVSCEDTFMTPSNLLDDLYDLERLRSPSSGSVSSKMSDDSCVGACCSEDLSHQGHQVSSRVLLNQITPKKSERQARSTVTGLMSQFSQLHCRRSILDRLTDAVGNLFGRMCIRRRRHRGLEQSPPADGDNTETLGAEAASRKEAKTVKSFTGAKKDYSAIPLVDEDFLQQLEDDLCGGEVYEEPTTRHYRSFSEMGPRIELRIGEGVEKLEVEGNKRYHEMSGDHFCH